VTYTVTARTPYGHKLLYAGKTTRAEVEAFARQVKRTFPEWSLTAYRLVQSSNVERPILRL
jgi:hypothetical protein